MNQQDIANLRLITQRIAGSTFDTVVDVVRFFGAVQAQEYAMSLWAIGLRMPEGTIEESIEKAIMNREIVRTWPMRGTLHFVPPEDTKWMLDLLTPRVIASHASYFRGVNLADADFEHAREVAQQVLEGGKILSRPNFHLALQEHGIDTKGYRGGHIVGWLAQKGVLCFGPREGKQLTLTLLEEWAPNQRTLESDEALAELTRRYFTSHGPATRKDFMWWSGLRVKEVQVGLELAKNNLTSEVVDGEEYWFAPQQASADTTGAYLLPIFDEHVVAYKDRKAITERTPSIAQAELVGGNNVIVNTQFVGRWTRTITKNECIVTIKPFTTLSKIDENHIHVAAKRYAAFYGLPAKITFLPA